MTERITHNLTLARKMLLAATGAVAVAGPVLIGIMHTPEGRADSGTTTSTFEVASIKPADPDSRNATMQFVPGGGLNVVNVPLKRVIAFAYGVFSNSQLAGGPEWIESQKFDIRAKGPEGPEASNGPRPSMEEQRKLVQSRLQALLADRFQLVTHREQKEMPVYALVLSKGGLKMKESAGEGPMMIRRNRGEMSAERATLEGLTANLSSMLDRPVVDRTNAKGSYDFTLQWMPEPGEPTGKGGPPLQGPQAAAPPDISGPSIFTALQEQLGLKLESSTAPVEIIVIDRVSQPSAN